MPLQTKQPEMKTFLNLMAACLFMLASCNKALETSKVNPYVSVMNASPTGATFLHPVQVLFIVILLFMLIVSQILSIFVTMAG